MLCHHLTMNLESNLDFKLLHLLFNETFPLLILVEAFHLASELSQLVN